MDYKTFCEDLNITYELRVIVNDEQVCKLTAYDFTGLEEQEHKIHKAIEDYATDHFAGLADDVLERYKYRYED